MKKTILIFSILVLFLNSCDKNKSTTENKTTAVEIYQTEVLQENDSVFKVISLNKNTGSLFIRDYNGSWYDATRDGLKKYQDPSYSIKVLKGPKENLFQVILTNNKKGDVYVRSIGATWYDGGGIGTLDKSKKTTTDEQATPDAN